MVIVIDSDIPWIPTVSAPKPEARLYHLDVDPLKMQMPVWYIAAAERFAVDAGTALQQLNAELDKSASDGPLVAARRERWERQHRQRKAELSQRERPGDSLTPEFLTAAIRRRVTADTMVVNEGVSNYQTIFDHLAMNRPGSMFTSGGGSLGGMAVPPSASSLPTRTSSLWR